MPADLDDYYRKHWLEVEDERMKRYENMFQWRDGLEALIAPADIRAGQVVADYGCGPGGLAIELARRVGQSGQVLALDMTEDAPGFETQRLRLLELYGAVLGTVAKPYPGISTLLQALAAHGVGWGIATNKPRAYTGPLLARLDMQPAPGSVVCPDDVSERKPHPESLLRNCRELGCCPNQAIYIGDHPRDIEAGRRAGMFTIAAAYGYIEPGDDPHRWGADLLVETSSELHDLILAN
jgi:phosphoglycolate phosphatase